MSTPEPGAAGETAGYRAADHAGAILTIDLDAIRANYRLLRKKARGAECAAVVKADAYGLGAERVAPALAGAGCRRFMVAQLEEGLSLRRWLGAEAAVYVLNGPMPGSEPVFAENDLVPVLNDPGQLAAWRALAARRGRALSAVLHIDTGMSRLGLAPAELAGLAAEPERLEGISLDYVMTHLVSAEVRDDPINARQLADFREALAGLPPAGASLANSSGIFLGPDYHFDLVRPGAALYGVNPDPGAPNPMRQAVLLEGRVIQLRDVDSPQTVGYGATHRVGGAAKIATIALGYADGYLRHLSNRGRCHVDDVAAPVVGRVSMDLITLDVSNVPPGRLEPGSLVEVLGPHYTVDDAGADAGTIGYEILTALGGRYHRRYLGGAPG